MWDAVFRDLAINKHQARQACAQRVDGRIDLENRPKPREWWIAKSEGSVTAPLGVRDFLPVSGFLRDIFLVPQFEFFPSDFSFSVKSATFPSVTNPLAKSDGNQKKQFFQQRTSNLIYI